MSALMPPTTAHQLAGRRGTPGLRACVTIITSPHNHRRPARDIEPAPAADLTEPCLPAPQPQLPVAPDAPAHAEPAHEDPAQEDPAHEEPAHDDPSQTPVAQDEPAQEDPAQDDPAQDEPAHED